MIWQDWVFTVGSLILTVGILPMLWHKHKPPLTSSIPVFVVLYAFTATYPTLNIYLACAIEGVQSTLWVALAVQRVQEVRRERNTIYWDEVVAQMDAAK